MYDHRQIYVLSREDIDPELQQQQNAWVELLLRRDIPVSNLPHLGLTEDQKVILAAMWFKNGLAGVTIGYPQTAFQLWCYVISSSQWWVTIFSAACMLHTCAPFLTVPACPWETEHQGHVDILKPTHGYWPLLSVMSLYIFAAIIYTADVFFAVVVNTTDGSTLYETMKKMMDKNRWLLFRMLACCVVIADIISFFAVHRSVRFSACLAPLTYITRRTSMQRILEGMFISLYKSSLVYGLYIAVLLFYSFLGFVVFQSVDVNSKVLIEDNNGFSKYQESVLTVLLSLMSRSYNLQSLALYFVNTPWSTAFFTSLIIVGDIFTSNMIIAVGNRQFRLFAARVFQRQLGNRKQAMVAIHELLSSDDGMLSRESWLGLCRHISGKNAMSDITADSLFQMECEQQYLNQSPSSYNLHEMKAQVDCIGFFRLCALLGNDIEVDVDNVPRTFAAGDMDDSTVGDQFDINGSLDGQSLEPFKKRERKMSDSDKYGHYQGGAIEMIEDIKDIVGSPAAVLPSSPQLQQQVPLTGLRSRSFDETTPRRLARIPSHHSSSAAQGWTRKESFDETPPEITRAASFNTADCPIRISRLPSNQEIADADWSAHLDESAKVKPSRIDTSDSSDNCAQYRVRRHITFDKTPHIPPVTRNTTSDSMNSCNRQTYILSRSNPVGPLRASFSWAFMDYNHDATLEQPPVASAAHPVAVKGIRKGSSIVVYDDVRTKSVSVNTPAATKRAFMNFLSYDIPSLRSDVYDLVEYRLHTAEIAWIRNIGWGLGELVVKTVPKIHMFAVVFNIARILIAVKVGFLSLNDSSADAYHAWRIFGLVLLILMWLETVMLIIAFGFTSYIRRTGFGYVFAINVIALVLKIMNMINNRPVQDRFTTPFYAALVVDCLRFIRFFAFLPGANVFMHILPLVMRIILIIFSVIYFFAVFANMRFCNSLHAANVSSGSDAAGWLNHEGVISFETIGLSILAMFEVAVLGNWTPLMSAIAEVDIVESKVFFIIYRAIMAQVVIPLLIAFVISAFISKRDSDEKKRDAATSVTAPVSTSASSKPTADDTSSERDISEFKFYNAYKKYINPTDDLCLSAQLESIGSNGSMLSPVLSPGFIIHSLHPADSASGESRCLQLPSEDLTKAAMKLCRRQNSTTSLQHSASSLTDLRKSESRFGQVSGTRFPIAPGASNTTSSNMMAMWGQSGGVSFQELSSSGQKKSNGGADRVPSKSKPSQLSHTADEEKKILQAKLDAALQEIEVLKKRVYQEGALSSDKVTESDGVASLSCDER